MAVPLRWGQQLLVNTTTDDAQVEPTIAGLADGRFVVAWKDWSETGGDITSSAIRAQVFNADGSKSGTELLVNGTTASYQAEPTIAALSSGGFVLAWTDGSSTGGDTSYEAVRAQVFRSDGTRSGSEFLVNTSTFEAQWAPDITALTDGRFVATWEDWSGAAGDSDAYAVRAQIFNANGTRSGNEFLVNTTTEDGQGTPAIASLTSGGFVVAWKDWSGTGGDLSGTAVRAQIYGADGLKVGAEFLVNSSVSRNQGLPAITGLPNGGFVAAWNDSSESLGDTSSFAVRAQVFDAAGLKVGREFVVNTTTEQAQWLPALAALPDGRFVAVWDDDSMVGGQPSIVNVRGQVFNPNGTRSGEEFLVNPGSTAAQGAPSITVLKDGRLVVGWTGNGTSEGGAPSTFIAAQIFDPRLGAVALKGTSLGDDFIGTAFGDTMSGEAGKDRLSGKGGADTLYGGKGDDRLDGGTQADRLEGGTGNDTYILAAAGDTVVERAGAGTDTVRAAYGYTLGANVENLLLTGSANLKGTGNSLANTLTGNSGANSLVGGAGMDVLTGGAGKDVLTGGLGNDAFVFNTALSGTTNVDTIRDMNEAGNDTIRLENAVFTALGQTGKLSGAAFRSNLTGLAEDSSDRIVFERDTGEIYYDSNGSNSGGTYVLFAKLDANIILTAADFAVL